MSKRTIYIITEETRYGEETWDLGKPDDIEIEYDHFMFDTKYGEPSIAGVQDDIGRLKELFAETAHETLVPMISQREAWIQEQLDEERAFEERTAAKKVEELEKARKLLRAAGEL